MKLAILMFVVWIVSGVMFYLQNPACQGKSDFDSRFCVEMLDINSVKSYACIIDSKDYDCAPTKKAIDKAVFDICGYKGD